MFCTMSLASNLAKQITVLKKLNTDGIITDEEFTKAKSILLEKAETKSTATESESETKVASLPRKIEEEDKESLAENFKLIQSNTIVSSRQHEKMEMYYKDYKIYVSRPGTIKIRRISDNKQLLTIQGDLKVKYYNDGEGLFDIDVTRKERPTTEEDIQQTVEDVKDIVKNPGKFIKDLLTPRSMKKVDKDAAKKPKDDIKLILKIDGKKLLHYEGRYVRAYKAFFYQVLTSGYEPFHFYITLRGRNPVALNMEYFNKKIDKAIRKAKKRLAIEYEITEAQIDKIIEQETGRATQEATQEAVQEAISKEVEAAVAQSIGEAMSAGVVSAIAQATGEAIDAAIESELAAAIDAEIAYAVSLGIEEAAVAAGWQAYFDVLTSGGTDAQASAAAYEACGSSCDGY